MACSRQLDRARRRVAAGAGEHRHAAVRAADDDLDDAAMLLRVSAGFSPVVPHGTRKLTPLVDLQIDEALQRRFVERAAVGERRDERGAEAFETSS